jgi:hypothetical protein
MSGMPLMARMKRAMTDRLEMMAIGEELSAYRI